MSLKSPIRLRNSLAFRLTVWYAGIFTLSSFIAFLIFYAFISSFIRGQTDQELLNQVSRFSILLSSGGPAEVRDSAIVEAEAAGVKKVFFRFLTINGQVFSSSNMSYWKDIDIDPSAINTLLQENRPVFHTISVNGRPEEIRVLYAPISSGTILQVGTAMESNSRFLDAFRAFFIFTMALLIVLAAGVGWFMARQAVSGIEDVTRTARRISDGADGSIDERVPVKSQEDEVDQLALTFNQMLDRIQTLLTQIKEMSDNIAHDLRSPIARIRGAAEVTLTSGKNPNEYETMAASTIEECDRLLYMINTMLMISKTESGVDRLHTEDVDLTKVARQACELFRPTAEDKGIKLECVVPDGIHLVGDTPMLQRMFSNLIDNAIKYTPTGGAVDVAARITNSHIILSVTDTGIGISQQDLPRIFERFYRCDESRSQEGLGLGLSLARAIARAQGGDITVSSTPSVGSTFTITLPAIDFINGVG